MRLTSFDFSVKFCIYSVKSSVAWVFLFVFGGFFWLCVCMCMCGGFFGACSLIRDTSVETASST